MLLSLIFHCILRQPYNTTGVMRETEQTSALAGTDVHHPTADHVAKYTQVTVFLTVVTLAVQLFTSYKPMLYWIIKILMPRGGTVRINLGCVSALCCSCIRGEGVDEF
jgi:hypothetical protein